MYYWCLGGKNCNIYIAGSWEEFAFKDLVNFPL